jgi:hypothetical protein
MKIKLTLICLFLFGIFFVPRVLANNIINSSDEQINSDDVVMNINKDSSVDVSETIVYNYGPNSKPGFSRFLPLKYQDLDGTNFDVKITRINVADENGKPYFFTVTKEENQDKTQSNLEIKIGNPKQNVSGTKTYVIQYHLRNAIKYLSDHDQLFWDITGNQWPVYVGYPSIKVNLPVNVKRYAVSSDCFIGLYSNTTECIDRIQKKSDPDVYYSYKGVVANEGMTFVFQFPKGIVYKPTKWQNFREDMLDNWNWLKTNPILLTLISAGLGIIVAAIVLIIVFRKKIGEFFSRIIKKPSEKENKNETEDGGDITDQNF